MRLKKTIELNIDHNEIQNQIRIDSENRFCLNDMAKFFPKKSLKQWLRNKSTKELIDITQDFLNGSDLTHLKIVSTKKGRHNSGTYAQEIIAMDFAMWLDPMFKLKVIMNYTQGKDALKEWNIDRRLSARVHQLQSEAIEHTKEDPKPYHYMNEAIMINPNDADIGINKSVILFVTSATASCFPPLGTYPKNSRVSRNKVSIR